MSTLTRTAAHQSLSRVAEAEAGRDAGDILARAFSSDSVLRYAIRNEAVLTHALPLLYEKLARVAIAIGGIELLSRRAAAIWLESRIEAPILVAIRFGFLRVLWRIGPRALLRLMRHEHYCAGRVRRVGPRRFGYVWMLGVTPDHQGEGWGHATLHRALDALRARGHDVCLLKTETEANVEFYRRSGFTCIDTSVVPCSGIRYWLMRKELGADSG